MKSIRKSMWGMYWKLHDKRKRLAASLKGYLDGLPPEIRRRIVLGMFAAFAVLARYTFGRAVCDIGRNDGSHMETGHAGRVELPTPAETGNHNTLFMEQTKNEQTKENKICSRNGETEKRREPLTKAPSS